MKLCFFVSDLHGKTDRYEKLASLILQERPAAVFMGGDLLPHAYLLHSSKDSSHLDFVNKFMARTFSKIKKELGLLYKQPEIGKTTEIESVRGLIIEEFIIFYEITPDMIIVHTVWDCKQNPDNLTIK